MAVFGAKYTKGVSAPASFKEIDYKQNGKLQNDKARELGMTLARVEDGHFDPKKPNDYYFVTTESNKDPKATAPNPATPTVTRDGGALWRLRFVDVNNPSKGASLTMLLDGSEEPYLSKPDNIVVDDAGNILSDAILEFDSFVVADIDVDQIMFTKSVYHHDTNGTQPTQDAQFYGAMGCNGIVSLKFTTPVYLWLLENM